MRTLIVLTVDSIRMLRSQMLFWIVLFLSGLVALVYASLGFNDDGITLLFGLMSFDHEHLRGGTERAKEFYLVTFTNMIIPWWMSAIAIVLALISCASIFPEFVRKGSVDLAVSKPPRRVVLFLGKYVGSLLFVFLQVFPFTLIVFLAFGFRFGEWNFTLFWAVPVVVLVFSLVYAMHVLISVWSGSTVFGLLAALLIWGMGALTEWTEFWIYQFAYKVPQAGIEMDPESDEGYRLVEPKDNAGPGWVRTYSFVNGMRTALPKTRSTSNQMKSLIKVGSRSNRLAGKGFFDLLAGTPNNEDVTDEMIQAEEQQDKRHSVWKDITSSVLYEFIVVGLAAFIFCRRDY